MMKKSVVLLVICFILFPANSAASDEEYVQVEPQSLPDSKYLGKDISAEGTFMRMVEPEYWKGRFYVAETKTAFYYDTGNVSLKVHNLKKGDGVKIFGKVFKHSDSESHYVRVAKLEEVQSLIILYDAKFNEMKNRNATAEGYYKLASEIDKRNQSAWDGIISEDLDQLKIDIFKASIEVDPEHEGAREALGFVSYNGKWMTAEEKQKLQRKEMINSALSEARSYWDDGQYKEAFAYYKKVLSLNPDLLSSFPEPKSPEERKYLAQLCIENATTLEQAGDYDQAVKSLRVALQFTPESADAHYNLGEAMAKKGDLDNALKEFERSAEIDPTLIDKIEKQRVQICGAKVRALYEAAVKEYERGKYTAAKEGFEAVIRQFPKSSWATKAKEKMVCPRCKGSGYILKESFVFGVPSERVECSRCLGTGKIIESQIKADSKQRKDSGLVACPYCGTTFEGWLHMVISQQDSRRLEALEEQAMRSGKGTWTYKPQHTYFRCPNCMRVFEE